MSKKEIKNKLKVIKKCKKDLEKYEHLRCRFENVTRKILRTMVNCRDQLNDQELLKYNKILAVLLKYSEINKREKVSIIAESLYSDFSNVSAEIESIIGNDTNNRFDGLAMLFINLHEIFAECKKQKISIKNMFYTANISVENELENVPSFFDKGKINILENSLDYEYCKLKAQFLDYEEDEE